MPKVEVEITDLDLWILLVQGSEGEWITIAACSSLETASSWSRLHAQWVKSEYVDLSPLPEDYSCGDRFTVLGLVYKIEYCQLDNLMFGLGTKGSPE